MSHKIIKPAASGPISSLELDIAQALVDLESQKELKKELVYLQFIAAKEVEVGQGKKAVVVFVPVPLLKQYHKVQARLTRELEKKFSDRHIIFIAQRRILPKPQRGVLGKQKRPFSRTLTNVHEKMLEDLVYPTEITGKRTRHAVDGTKLMKVQLDAKDSTALEYKLDTFRAVYKQLTGKHVVFEFPSPNME